MPMIKYVQMTCVAILVMTGTASADAAESDKMAAVSSLLQADRDFAALSEKEGPRAAFDAYLSSHPLSLPALGPAVEDRNVILGGFVLEGGAIKLLWTPMKADVGPSHRFGYTWGTYDLTIISHDGGQKSSRGKYLNVWQVEDGEWKVLVDLGNTDPTQSTNMNAVPN